MAFPQPGDVSVKGEAGWVYYVPVMNQYVGLVLAYMSIYGTPDADVLLSPTIFSFASGNPIEPGAAVTFDVVQGNYWPYAVNVQQV
jgi:hypothetical protein